MNVDPSILADWPRDALAKLYVTCCVMELKRVGMLGGGNYEAGENLPRFWAHLRSMEFVPARYEIDEALNEIPLAIPDHLKPSIADMIERFDEAMGYAQDLHAEMHARHRYECGWTCTLRGWAVRLKQWLFKGANRGR